MTGKKSDMAANASAGKTPGRFDDLSLDELVALLEEPGEPAPPKRRQSRAKASADEWERACAEWGLRPDDNS